MESMQKKKMLCLENEFWVYFHKSSCFKVFFVDVSPNSHGAYGAYGIYTNVAHFGGFGGAFGPYSYTCSTMA
jgi:hypothetical protein